MWKEHKNLDYASQAEVELYQSEALRKHLAYLDTYSDFYQNLFAEQGIDVSSIENISQLVALPTTEKEDLARENKAFLCRPERDIVEYVTTSGTLGKAITLALTKNDLDRLTYNEARSLAMAGIDSDEIVQITTTLDKRFMAGMAYYLGAVQLGAAVIRTGIGNPGFQWENILRYKPTATIAVPSFLVKLAAYGAQINMSPSHTSLKKAICIGEPLRNSDFSPNKLKQKILKSWNIELYSTYASTEMMTAFTECKSRRGGHHLPELIIVEILDEKGFPVPAGTLGEVTVTPLGVEGMPLLRFRTGDLARAHTEPCTCGRKTLRLGPIEGRKKQMIKLKGTTLFPQSIEDVIQSFDEIELHVIELSHSSIDTDHVKIYFTDRVSDELLNRIRQIMSETLRVTPEFERIPMNELLDMLFPKGSRKPMKIIDKRNIKELQ